MKKFLHFFQISALCLCPCKLFAKGVITYQQFKRLNTPQLEDAANNFVDFQYLNHKTRRSIDTHLDLSFRMYPGTENNPVFSMPEAYISHTRGTSDSGKQTWLLGRKIVDWNPHEKFWGLSQINAVRGFNLLEQDQEGLSGLHFIRKRKNFKIHLYGTYFHIPQVNPTYSIKDGQVTSPNEWSVIPPRAARYNGVEVPIFYQLDTPNYGKLLAQPGYGGNIAFGDEESLLSAYYAWKPENQIRLNATGFYESVNGGQANVTARPFINHTEAYGIGYRRKTSNNISVEFRYDEVNPERGTDPDFEFESLRIEPFYTKISYATASATYQNDYLTATANFIENVYGDVPEDDILGTSFPKWRRAVGANINYVLNDKISIFLDYKYDVTNQDMIIKNEYYWQMDKHFVLTAGYEFLQAPTDDSYWTYFRSNDSVYSSISYDF